MIRPVSADAPRADDGNVVGNHYDKYATKNPIARWLVGGFLDAVGELYAASRPRTVLEVGCGEGRLAQHLLSAGPRPERFVITDVDTSQVAADLDPLFEVQTASIYELPFSDDAFDLVVCCEVLEHVARPEQGLAELARVAGRHVLVSTPREPLWRALNVARGRYLTRLGNTPGHIQHFSKRALTRLVSSRLQVLMQRSPLPWTVLLGEPKPT